MISVPGLLPVHQYLQILSDSFLAHVLLQKSLEVLNDS